MLLVSGVAPSLAVAASGGAGVPTGKAAVQTAGADVVQPGDVSVNASGNGITLRSVASALLRRSLQFRGSVPASDAGRTIVVERSGHETGWTWKPTVTATVRSDGSFSATWTTDHIGRFSIRALIASHPSAATVASASPPMAVTVYRPSIATEYGPGFWGRRTACGKKLTHRMLGVANRTLKCGEDVALYYKGRTMIVPVIDRGPYANNADWDLTQATAKALGIPGTATLGAVSLPQQPPR